MKKKFWADKFTALHPFFRRAYLRIIDHCAALGPPFRPVFEGQFRVNYKTLIVVRGALNGSFLERIDGRILPWHQFMDG